MKELKDCPFKKVEKEFPHEIYYYQSSGRMQCACGAAANLIRRR